GRPAGPDGVLLPPAGTGPTNDSARSKGRVDIHRHLAVGDRRGCGGAPVRERPGNVGARRADRRRHGSDAALFDARLSTRTDARYCWTSISGLPSGSVIAASVGPPGTSKGSLSTVPPRSLARLSDARRSRTWT